MRHGISFLPDCSPDTKSAAQYFADAITLAVLADSLGMTSVKMTEHYLGTYGGYCPSPLSFLSNVAARTHNVRLKTGCILPAFHHPVQIAAETAMVDVMSSGRLDVGFARAWLPYEFEAFGVDLDDSRELFTESVNAVIRLWTEESVTLKTRFFELHEARSTPKPLQQPHPPTWGAAVLSPESFAALAEAGHNLMLPSSISGPATSQQFIAIYRDAFAEAHPQRRGQVAISVPLFIGDSTAEANELADRFLARYLRVWTEAGDSWNTVRSSNYRNYTGMSYALRMATPERLRHIGAAIVGDKRAVTEQLSGLASQLDVDEILWQVDFGAMPGELAERTLRYLADDVLPNFSPEPQT